MTAHTSATIQRTEITRVGIIGLGLIGGSIARALKAHAGVPHVVGMARKKAVLDAALADGSIDQGALLAMDEYDPDPFVALAGCDVVFLCTPIDTFPALAERITAHCDGILTDVGSVKLPVERALERYPRFIGGHPMAGSERTGYACSSADLLEKAVYVISVPVRADPQEAEQAGLDADALEQLIGKIGATPIRLDAKTHDRSVATISHLPHAVASALSVLAAEHDEGVLSSLAAGGFKDITRIASASSSLWTGICMESAPALLPVMDAFIEVFTRFRQSIEDADRDGLSVLFREGAEYRTNLPIAGRGALDAYATLRVQIPDRPGMLAEVARILGDLGISIRNMDITNIRMYDSGVLRILLYDSNQTEVAVAALTEAGYACEI